VMREDIETEYRLGCEAHSREDYATALERWKPIAIQGHPTAQYLMGCLHDQGQRATQDDEEAVKWFRLAAEQGDPDAQFALGEKYLAGKGVPHDLRVAAKWYILADETGHQVAGQILEEIFYFANPDCVREAYEARRLERANLPSRGEL
jgi:TPR repeat protein